MAAKSSPAISVIGIDIGKNAFHIVGLDERGAMVLRQRWSCGQIEARLANLPPCLVGMEACVGAHHLSRKLEAAKYVRPYSKGQKNDFRDAEAIAEAVQRPTMKFVATKTADCRRMLLMNDPSAHCAKHFCVAGWLISQVANLGATSLAC